MSDDEQAGSTTGTTAGTTGAGGVMTPPATAVAGFTLAALALTGQGIWTGLAQTFWGSNFAPSSLGSVLASGFLATLVVEGIALLLARHALAEPVAAAVDGPPRPGHRAARGDRRRLLGARARRVAGVRHALRQPL